MNAKQNYYFCGIGGNGMSPLARLLAAQGATVTGSDRAYDIGRNKALFDQLAREGIKLVAQDGAAVTSEIGTFVVTRAVEDSIPDIKKARELGLKILKRPLLMAEIFAQTQNIAVGGTSGKSTTTGMIGHILSALGKSPTVMNGALMVNGATNFFLGSSNTAVFEADESDGYEDVISVCPADIAVLTNISLDHFELDELKGMFSAFLSKARIGAVLNRDCENSMLLRDVNARTVSFGLHQDADFNPVKYPVTLSVPGAHNVANAMAALASCSLLDIDPTEACTALKSFLGIKRRLELVGEVNGIRVIDDFASNPGKIEASTKTAIEGSKRAFLVFQPHGFQPTKMMKQGYIDTFSGLLRVEDELLMPDIFYVGGSANLVNGEVVSIPKDISSADVTRGVLAQGRKAQHIPQRSEIVSYLNAHAQAGDVILVMGSRDESLSDFAMEIMQSLKG
jgi:UDP-N-acetylmuramate--alanine ligase